MARITFIGFGELAAALAEGLAGGGRHELRAYLRNAPASGSATGARLRRVGVRADRELRAALSGADAVLVAVPGSACAEVAGSTTPFLDPGTLYVDLSSAPPQTKSEAAVLIGGRGGDYADAAVLGTVVVSGHRVPIVASGPGAERFRVLVEPDGLPVDVLSGPPGAAATVKLLRSVYLKGRDALVTAMLLAARRHGVQDVVVQSIGGPGEQVPFPVLTERILCSVAVHAQRRGEELADAAEILEQVGVNPALAVAGSELLRDLAALGLREVFDGRRPNDAAEVLWELDRRWPRAAS